MDNGKSREFTEYILPGDMDKNFSSSSVSPTYTSYYKGQNHFNFASESAPVDLSSYSDAISATTVKLPFNHNKPSLEYDESTQNTSILSMVRHMLIRATIMNSLHLTMFFFRMQDTLSSMITDT